MKIIIATRGEQVMVSDQDYDAVSGFSWNIDRYGYARRTIGSGETKKTVMMHRFLLGLQHGDGYEVDHIDGDKTNNTRENLKACSRSENVMNRRRYANNKSGMVGVSFRQRDGVWSAGIKHKCVSYDLGSFKTIDEAAHAYNKAAIELRGDLAALNPVGEVKS